MDLREYEYEEKVFARVKGYSPWPARILEITGRGTKNSRFLVYFYGTKESANLKYKDIYPFFENLNTLGRPKKLKTFNDAMKDIIRDFTPGERKMYELESGKATAMKKKAVSEQACDERKQSHNKSTSYVAETDSSSHDSSHLPPSPISGKFTEISRYGRKIKPKSFPDHQIVPQSNNITLSIGNDTITIPLNDKILAFHTTEDTLMAIDIGLRDSLSIGKLDLDRAITLLNSLLNLDLTPLMLKKIPDIVDVIRKTMRFFGVPPKGATEIETKEFKKKAATIRDKSGMAYKKFECLFDVPSSKDFYEHFKELRDALHEKYKDKFTEFFSLTDV